MVTKFTPLKGPEEDNPTSWYTSAIAGIGSGLIKVPEGVVSLAAELLDLGADTNTAVKVEQFFDKINPFDEIAEANAAGRLTEAITSIGIPGAYGFKIGTKIANKLAKRAIDAKKGGRYVTITPGMSKVAERTRALNEKAGVKRFAAGVMGGAAGEMFVADVEDIGSFGDIFTGSPTRLDKDERVEGRGDATRKLLNRVKFGSESLLVVPFVAGVGKSAKLLATQGKELAYSSSRFNRALAKLASTVTPEGGLTKELFEGVRTFGGLKAGDINEAQRLFKNITREINKIFPELKHVYDKSLTKEKDEFMEQLNELLLKGDLDKGINVNRLDNLVDALKEKNISKEARLRIKDVLNEARGEFNSLIKVVEGAAPKKKAGEVVKEIKGITADRIKSFIGNTYNIFEQKGILGFKKYLPTDQVYNDTVNVIRRSLSETNKKPLLDDTTFRKDAEMLADEILKQVSKMKKPPALPNKTYNNSTMEGQTEKAFTQLVDLGGTIKVKDKKIIIKDADKKVFQEFFGKFSDPRYTIIQGMGALSSLRRTVGFLDDINKTNSEIQKTALGGPPIGRGFFWGSQEEAARATNNVADIVPLDDLMSELTQNGIISNPLIGKFTTREIKEALRNATGVQGKLNSYGILETVDQTNVAKNAATTLYRSLLLFPKGVSQLAKTVLSIPTHLRNFISAAAFSAANGIMFNPRLVRQGFDEALGGLGPRTAAGILRFGERSTKEQEALYRELLELGVVNSQVQVGDLKSLFRDMGFGAKSVDIDSGLKPMMSRLQSFAKGAFRRFQGQYIAEDDFFKILNYAGEYGRLKNAYTKNNVSKTMKEIKQEAADIVKNTVPNYDYVGNYVKLARNLPFGNFMSFPSEMIRTTTGIGFQAIKEMKHSRPTKGSNITPVVFDIGANAFVKNDNIMYGTGLKRITGMATTMTVFPAAITETAKAAYDVSEDELQALRQFVPDWSKNSTLVPVRDDDGTLKYIDLSHSLAYDLMARPFRTLTLGIQQGELDGDSLLASFVKSLDEATADIASPFIDESIWTEAAANVTFRQGRTRDGRLLYTEQTSPGDKAVIRLRHLADSLAPTYKQFVRLGQAAVEAPTKTGEVLELDDQLAGFIGFRPIKVDPEKALRFKIYDFQKGIREARREFTGGYFGLLKGGPVEPDDIIDRYIVSNKARFNVQKEMYKNIIAAQTLGTSQAAIRREFKDRQISDDAFSALKNGRFVPYFPSESIQDKFREIGRKFGGISAFRTASPTVRSIKRDFQKFRLEDRPIFNQGGIAEEPTPIDDVLPILRDINANMRGLNLAGDFDIDFENFKTIIEQQNIETPPIPLQVASAEPNAQVITQGQQVVNQGLSAQNPGLTRTENALYSDAEKEIALRNRGIKNA